MIDEYTIVLGDRESPDSFIHSELVLGRISAFNKKLGISCWDTELVVLLVALVLGGKVSCSEG